MNRLSQIKKLDELIDAKINEVERLDALRKKVNVCMEGERVQTSGFKDISTYTDSIIDLQKEIDADIDRFINLKRNVMEQIDKIPNALVVKVLYKKFFEYKTIFQVAEECDISRQWVSELIKKYYHDFDC